MANRRSRRPKGEFSRRVFIQRLTFFGGGVVLLGSACKKEEATKVEVKKPRGLTTSHKTFTNDEYDVVAAACERIIPKDEDPGALEANVPEYIDRMLQSPELSKMKEEFLSGTAALDRRATRMFKVGFAQASAAQRDELLTLFKDSPKGTGEARFYELLVVLTLEGLLGDPSYGGNKDQVGWKLVGFSMVGHQAAAVPTGYDGQKHLHHAGHEGH
ncbi:MAG: gluconate 2-dehydrogenase subunit 3 family protein [Myxococcota bacterium]